MTSYNELNNALNNLFFSGLHSGSPVYLSLEDDEREYLAENFHIPSSELSSHVGEVVASTLDFSKSNIYIAHKEKCDKWKKEGMIDPPPFTALLLALTMAAEQMRSEGDHSASNYYERLFEVFGVGVDQEKQKIRTAARFTPLFWQALNLWLTRHDYFYGKPTATQVNNWKYVSYAISQSLVRRGDRARFHSLFSEFGLSPNDKLSESEMTLYLHEWMAGSGPSQWLKHLWESLDIRDRVASAALDELEQWDGRFVRSEDASSGYRRLTWFAVIRTFPLLRCRLHLVAGAGDGDSGTALRLTEAATGLAREALNEAESVWLEAMPDTGLRVLGPEDKIKLGALLLTSLELASEEEGDLYRHDSRPVIPLIKDETGRYYREVSRVTLHAKHLVLCHTNWAGQVSSYLEEFAQRGFSKIAGNSSNGIPAGWTLFREVAVSAAPTSEVNDNLQCLVPISSGATINMSGGLKLAQNIWHASAPPQVIASDEDGFIEIKLQSESLGSKSETIASTQPENYDPDFISTSRQALDARNLTVTGFRNGKNIVERSLAFRSAKTPRHQANVDSTYAYLLDKSRPNICGFSAVASSEVRDDSPVIRGMLVEGEFDAVEQGLPAPDSSELPTQGAETLEEVGFDMASVRGDEATCILRGYHYFICPPYLGPGHGEVSRVMQCRDCHIFQIASKPKRGRGRRSTRITRQIAQPSIRFEVSADEKVSPNSVFDALCYLGSGTWASIVPILSSIVEEPWQVSIVKDDLVDLGLIDVAMDSDFGRPRYWSCPPPALAVTRTGTAFLAGFRNAVLVQEVKARMDEIADGYRLTKHDLAPVAHTWDVKGLELGTIRERLSDLVGPLGRKIVVTESPGLQIASQMPSVDEILRQLDPLQVEDGDDIERFDPRTCRWERSEIRGEGAYRALFHGRRYFYCTGDGVSLEASPELAKVLAARFEGVRLHSYNEATQTLDCALGCKPPGLFRRSLVSESGVLPVTSDERHSYTDVSPTLAGIVLQKLYR